MLNLNVSLTTVGWNPYPPWKSIPIPSGTPSRRPLSFRSTIWSEIQAPQAKAQDAVTSRSHVVWQKAAVFLYPSSSSVVESIIRQLKQPFHHQFPTIPPGLRSVRFTLFKSTDLSFVAKARTLAKGLTHPLMERNLGADSLIRAAGSTRES